MFYFCICFLKNVIVPLLHQNIILNFFLLNLVQNIRPSINIFVDVLTGFVTHIDKKEILNQALLERHLRGWKSGHERAEMVLYSRVAFPSILSVCFPHWLISKSPVIARASHLSFDFTGQCLHQSQHFCGDKRTAHSMQTPRV